MMAPLGWPFEPALVARVTLSRNSGDFTSLSATNVIVENGVKLPDGTYQRTSPTGPFVLNPALVDAETKALIDKFRVAVAPIANRIVGSISADITRTANAAQESALGDVIADAQLAYTQSAGAQIAFMNPAVFVPTSPLPTRPVARRPAE
jgi:5'-nucleotidase